MSLSTRLVWFKNSLVPVADAKISLLSPSAQFGISTFEGIRGYWDASASRLYLFRLQDHIIRLQASCKLAHIPLPSAFQSLLTIVKDTIKANNYTEDIAIRIIVFLDEEGSWSSFGPSQIAVAPIPKPRQSIEKLPLLSACFSSWRRIDDLSMPPTVKLGANYSNGRYAQFNALSSGFDIPFFLDSRGFVSETPGSCIFFC